MRSIVFNVQPDLGPQEQESLLGRLPARRPPGRAPAPTRRARQRAACVTPTWPTTPTSPPVRDRIAGLPGVESADVPPERGLS